MFKKEFMIFIVITVLLFTEVAYAQVDETQTDDNYVVETIIVTAQKRYKTLRETPIAVSVLSGEELEKAQITDVQDLQVQVPSLTIPQEESPSTTAIRIRGLGTAGDNPGLEPSVGVFVDGVYRSRVGSALNDDFMDVERVEVLRGPQSTIYGKNTPAGVISIITKGPEYDFGANAEITVGNYNLRTFKASITSSIGEQENVAFKLSGVRHTRDGFIENLNDGSDLNNRDRYGVRAQLLIEPSDDTYIRLIADYNEIDENCCAAPFVFNLPANVDFLSALGANILPDNPFDRRVNFDGNILAQNKTGGVSAEVIRSYDGFDFTSITAYRSFDEANSIDADFINIPVVDERQINGEINTFTQEFRLTSTGRDNVVDWMLGGYYFNQDLFSSNVTNFGSSMRSLTDLATGGLISGLEEIYGVTQGLAPGSFFAEGTGLNARFNQDSESYALFSNFDWHATNQLTVSAGLRYTKENKSVRATINNDSFSQVSLDDPEVAILIGGLIDLQLQTIGAALQSDPSSPFFELPIDQIINNLPPAVISQVQNEVGGAVALGIVSFQFFPTDLMNFNDSRSEDNLSGDLTFAYEASDNTRVYAKYARGYKAGGFNLSNSSRAGSRSFSKETIDAFEIGFKTSILNDTVRVNLALYDQTLRDQQVAIFNGTTFDINNAGDVSARGFEWDVQAQPSNNLLLMFSGAFLDAKYDSFSRGPCTVSDNAIIGSDCQLLGFQDFSGRGLDNVARWNIFTSIRYSILIGRYDGFIRLDSQYRSKFNSKEDLDPIANQPSTNIINASIGLTSPSGNWDMTLWARNITDEETLQVVFNSIAQPGSFNGFPNDPTTFGITLRWFY